ncbi:2-C-methyl-D-erythritol 4-phosphate cytidylyltransferase [Chryseobacterium sp. AG363]|uniref:2-C-methyl-D-erythritol 4-phosphate cytidylyltransferase n=1 Tax=Chryseobacterium sp. AG363 TaxID=2183997 RepID=UPI000FF0E3F0|nr:2-C-methyl-D-erythritol 4-phosphate cytidylyltransferase [Chryseobacterium sp. AG363]RKE81576.1 2-C-methyl-D-erythritol 4-phosphate cytidylyltransferase [Chryseobacterium sp. AG363]
MRTKKYIIIVAAGEGNRMGAEIAKQFLPLDGKPILIHTIDAFLNHPTLIFDIILVLNNSHLEMWDNLCQQYYYLKPIKIVIGGRERFHSVKNAIDTITDHECYIGIHDGVRPFVSETVIERAFSEVIEHDAVVPIVPMIPTIRMTDGENNRSMNRTDFKVVQTPQVFRSEIIKRAYQTPYQSTFFDDATVVEFKGYTIKLIEGNDENIKITLPIDYLTAKALQKTKLIHDISN